MRLRWDATVVTPSYGVFHEQDGAVQCGSIAIPFRGKRETVDVYEVPGNNDPVRNVVFEHPGFSPQGKGRIYCDDVADEPFATDADKFALFSAALPVDTTEQAAIEQLFDRLAHRITILVHEAVEPQDLGLIKHIATQETPAHVAFRVLSASHPFLVGMSALVGVDSYLARRDSPAAARYAARSAERPALVTHSRAVPALSPVA